MEIIETNINGVFVIVPKVHKDERGFFCESYNYKDISKKGIKEKFVQDNHSRSEKNVIRGLHFQKNYPQGKLVRCTFGCVFDVVLDIRKDSATYGEHFSTELSSENFKQIWIPEDCAHGFCVLSDFAEFQYKCTQYYYPNDQYGVRWNDPALNINWPSSEPKLSAKDKSLPLLEELSC